LKRKDKGKQEPKICHPEFIFTSAVPGQVRKTIDRIYMNIFWGNQKTDLFKGFLGKMCLLASPATPSTSTHPRFTLELFEKDTLKGKEDQRSKNPRSTHPALILGGF